MYRYYSNADAVHVHSTDAVRYFHHPPAAIGINLNTSRLVIRNHGTSFLRSGRTSSCVPLPVWWCNAYIMRRVDEQPASSISTCELSFLRGCFASVETRPDRLVSVKVLSDLRYTSASMYDYAKVYVRHVS